MLVAIVELAISHVGNGDTVKRYSCEWDQQSAWTVEINYAYLKSFLICNPSKITIRLDIKWFIADFVTVSCVTQQMI